MLRNFRSFFLRWHAYNGDRCSQIGVHNYRVRRHHESNTKLWLRKINITYQVGLYFLSNSFLINAATSCWKEKKKKNSERKIWKTGMRKWCCVLYHGPVLPFLCYIWIEQQRQYLPHVVALAPTCRHFLSLLFSAPPCCNQSRIWFWEATTCVCEYVMVDGIQNVWKNRQRESN